MTHAPRRFGIKGGAAGGGYSQVIPMEEVRRSRQGGRARRPALPWQRPRPATAARQSVGSPTLPTSSARRLLPPLPGGSSTCT